jgi:hypothetical protein
MMRASFPGCLEIATVWLEISETDESTPKWEINQLLIDWISTGITVQHKCNGTLIAIETNAIFHA